MENNYIYDFLSLKSTEDQKTLMKTWLGLLIAFTIVFMDIGFLLNFSNKENLIYIPLTFTIFVLVIYLLYFIIVKKIEGHISYSILYNAIVTTITSLLFYTLFSIYVIAEDLSFSGGHIIALLISLIFIISALVYRYIKFRFNKKKQNKSSRYIAVVPVVLLVLPILRKSLSNINQPFLLTIAFLLVGGIWLLISLIYWQNYYYGKKNNIDKVYSLKK